mmetsp:Transcript_26349/g.36775  ORF Transcript_26349/g.36775 Transcript_26349/m.36775 type:complete len:403 (-) Transcript_26349:193-1401(-)|eukprot:CAMPEP_0185267816 /NCGR_PEP_ID=MMETSP1359-20130426/35351_1 /TAXON_ID=552665 /ORGANISM="Bigelowiella longifila, Strain CCMP242" /LENGTH=402 /DNA_ID=CAMNT_0027858317 /DNA_START=44 /DNA_END=1252 /DNA_ORIENTATION=+
MWHTVLILTLLQNLSTYHQPQAKRTQQSHQGNSAWDYLRSQLEAWPFTEDFAVEVGNAKKGRLFLFEKGNMTMDRKVMTASTSKWPIASMITAVVADGKIDSLDDKASKYLTWWTKDPKDSRSKVTLRMLLSFTSGFGGGAPGEGKLTIESVREDGPICMANVNGNFMKCARQIYEKVKLQGEPGKVFSYNSYHLQLAGAIAVAATKKNITQILDDYLFKSFNMYSTDCMGGASNPPLAVCLETTGKDYGNFLHRILAHKVIPKSITNEMEKDYTPVPVMAAGPTLFGHYCFGHFYECFDSELGFTEACRKANIHSDPGAFGYYPLVDRSNGYYMQVVVEESGRFYNRSGIPEYIRLLAKPYVDLIMNGKDPSYADRSFAGKLTLEDVNYIQACYMNHPSCY